MTETNSQANWFWASAAKRLVLNEVTYFIDKVTDKGQISASDINDLMIGVNSYGGTFDVTVTRYIPVAVRDNASGAVKTTYAASDDNINSLIGNSVVSLESGDAVQVKVEGIGLTKGQSLIRGILRVDERQFNFTLAGMVR